MVQKTKPVASCLAYEVVKLLCADRGIASEVHQSGVVTLSAISLISAIKQQAKWLKYHASAFAVISQFRSV
jgi:hypothetical protein